MINQTFKFSKFINTKVVRIDEYEILNVKFWPCGPPRAAMRAASGGGHRRSTFSDEAKNLPAYRA
jgi:hypothetical protein